MAEEFGSPEHRQASAIGRALISLGGVGASVAGGIGIFLNLRLLAQDVAVAADGTRSLFAPMTAYHFAWLAFFAGMLSVGISLIAASIKGRSEDIVPGPSLYIMGAALLIAAMCQLLFGRPGLAAVSALAGVALMVAEYRSAFL